MFDDKPFRIVVSVIRGTNAGRALGLMASGMQCAGGTYEEALKHYEHYMDAAECILSAANNVCFGTILIVDTRDGGIRCCEALMGKAKVVRVTAGGRDSLTA